MFSVKLKILRENAGYSQQTLASALGVAQSTVGNWEAGTREPNLETIQRLADFFHVTVDYLLDFSFSTDDMLTAQQKMKFERERVNYTLSQAAALLLMDTERLREIEEGEAVPTIFELARWVTLFSYSADYLLGLVWKPGDEKNSCNLETNQYNTDIKNSPASKETGENLFSDDERAYRLLVDAGYLVEGEDFTLSQLQVYRGIVQILNAAFPRKDDLGSKESTHAG